MLRSLLVASVLAVPCLSPVAEAQEPGAPPPSTPSPPGAPPSKLEAEIAKELGQSAPPAAAQPGAAQAAPGGPAAAPAQASTGGNPLARLLLLPDISAIGSGALAYDSYDVEARSPREDLHGQAGKPTFLFDELELGLQAVVDPYVRADVFLSFDEHGAGIEEAYVTTLSLPASLQVRAGRFFTPFGRLNGQHGHTWDFVDAPLARSRLLAGDALGGPGVDLAWLAPLPWFAELRLAAQNTEAAQSDAQELTGTARLTQYFQLTDAATLGVGLSAARRGEGHGGEFRDLGGADVYLRFRPAAGRAYVTLQGEVYARRFRDVPDAPQGTDTGWWLQAFLRQSPWWGYGVRYDQAPAAEAVDGVEAFTGGEERRVGGLLVWYPSEFLRLRLQGSYDHRPAGRDGLEALLHVEFVMGAHGAHPF